MSGVAHRVAHMRITDCLDFEAERPRHTPAKDEAIRARGLTPARYYVLLARAARSAEGQAHDAITARRVRERAASAA